MSVMLDLVLRTAMPSAPLANTAKFVVDTATVLTTIRPQTQSMALGCVCATQSGRGHLVSGLSVTDLFQLRGGARDPVGGWLRVYAIKRSATAGMDFLHPLVQLKSVQASAVVMECAMTQPIPMSPSVLATLDLVEWTAVSQHAALQLAMDMENVKWGVVTAKKGFLVLVVKKEGKRLLIWHKKKMYVRPSYASARATETATR